ncbi:MAG: hypothetical protein V3U92_08710 [Cellulophaga sp.]
MKKKLYLMAIAILGVVGASNAQAQNPECMTNLSIFSEHAKVKNYDAAYTPWKMVYAECPGLNNATFILGKRILADKIKKSSGADKDAYISDLLTLHDEGRKYFPAKSPLGKVLVNQALLKFKHKMASDEELYNILDKAFTEDRKNFKHPRALYLYFSSLVNLHKSGKKDLQAVFNAYDEVTEKVGEENKKLTILIKNLLPKEEAGTLTNKEKKRLKSATTNSKSFGKIASSIDSKLGALADCGNLIPLYKKSFDAKKNDVVWVKRAVGRMFSKDCTDDPLFKQLFEAQLALDPSAKAYMYGGMLKMKAGDTKGAIADFNKAGELETDSYKKSDLMYKIAVIYKKKGSKSTSRNYAQKALSANSSNGKAYLLIASLYAGSANQCGTSRFEKLAIYWKAASMARKASRVDPSLSSRAKRSAASYSAKAPTKTDIFNSGMGGKTVTFKCWVGGSVKVPSL